ncbi:complement C1q-like protein 4 [Mytilus californianus]|uniref:complement C1q-like protein 4 n=1 Tax=Mytilus californianus TaxID=6549 RepID=UPI002246232A|nr:complement C1q-like protein 4 [Mytilus californianus]
MDTSYLYNKFLLLTLVLHVTYSDTILDRLQKLEQYSTSQNEKISSLENVITHLENTVRHLDNENSELRSVQTILTPLLSRRRAHQDQLNVKDARRLLLDGPSNGQYAFYAFMSRDEPEPGGHHLLVYDNVVTNVGNAFNNFTGIFTVPRSGIYSFTWSTRVACHKAHTTELVINTRILGSTYVYCGYNTVTGHVVTSASQGEAIFVRTHLTSPGQGAIKSDEFGRSAFSGFMIG